MPARVATAGETVACERATISAGTSSLELMERAGRAAADEIIHRFRRALPAGVAVFTGPGNNGGDGWVVARCLGEAGFPVTVIEAAPAKTDEARAAEAEAGVPLENAQESQSGVSETSPSTDVPSVAAVESANFSEASVIVDALLGTGAKGAPREPIASAIELINAAGQDGAVVVALDLPSGLDATTGTHELAVHADLTLTFGELKRGHLLARELCGEIVVLDIGLVAGPEQESLPLMVDHAWVSSRVPEIPTDAHKGTRGQLAIVAGGQGMAGAAILSGKGALRSGIGLLHLVVAQQNIVSIHAGLPEAIVHDWPTGPDDLAMLTGSVDAIAIGPGLGNSHSTRDLVERVLLAWTGPVVVDADALNVFANDSASLATLLRGRPAVITPHPAELARLLGCEISKVVAERFDVGLGLARETGAAVLLKGTPTVIFSPDGRRYVSAAGTAALATGGSGDVLTGMTGTLLAQMTSSGGSAAEAAAVAAFIHGRAAELCGPVRGTTLEDILLALPEAWNETIEPASDGVLTCVPPVP